MSGNRKVITGSHPHALVCNHCSGIPVLKSVFVYDADPTRTQLCFFAEPCAPYVYAIALAANLTQQENEIFPYNGTVYSIRLTNDAAPIIAHQQDFPANTMNDMWVLFVPANNSKGYGTGYVAEPTSFSFFTPFVAEAASLRPINIDRIPSHQAEIDTAGSSTGIVGFELGDVEIQWICGYNNGGNSVAAQNFTYVVNFTHLSTYGIILRQASDVTEVTYFYLSALPYTMFEVDAGYFFGTQSDGSFDIIDLITDPTTPTLVSHTAALCTIGECLKRAGDVVWIGDSATGDLIGVDVSSFASPSVISTTALGDTPKGLAVCGEFVYVSLLGGAVVCYDVSTPSAPVLNVTVPLSDFTPYQKQLQLGFNHVYVLGIQTSTGKPALAVLRA